MLLKHKSKTNTEQTRQIELNQTLTTHVHKVAFILSKTAWRIEMPHCGLAYLIVCHSHLLKFFHLTKVYFYHVGFT